MSTNGVDVLKWGFARQAGSLGVKSSFVVPKGFKLVPSQNHIVLKTEYGIEADGRVIADIAETPGAVALGRTAEEATQKALAIALEIIADEIRHGERLAKDIVITSDARQVPGKFQITSPYTFEELMAQTDFDAIDSDEDLQAWLNIKPVGRELL